MNLRLGHQARIDVQTEDYIGILYLLTPLVLFFAIFTISLIAIPTTLFLCYCITRLRPIRNHENLNLKLIAFNAFWAALIVLMSGSTGPLYVNGDWYKHYAILNELAQHSALAEPEFTLRYYIGLYVAPAQIERMTGPSNGVIISIWIWLGLCIFFNQLSNIISKQKIKYIAPIIFMLFSGADIIGYSLTHFMRGNIYHFEWWAGWIEYSSTFTSIIWAPQSTLPAWIAIAYFFKRPPPNQQVFAAPLILIGCLLWSPFAAAGIAPFLLLPMIKPGLRSTEINVTLWTGIGIIGGLICYYLTFDVAKIPRSWVWNNPCLFTTTGEPCFTISGYIRFILLEVAPVAAICMLYKPTRNGVTYISAAILLLFPLVQFGAYNDLAMNASKPALAALITGMILSLESLDVWPKALAALTLALGVTTPGSEAYRALTFPRPTNIDITISDFTKKFPEFATQYSTKGDIFFLRKENSK